ncbi:MAG: hypothetical protein ACE5HI_10110 [bacterium]
MVLGAVKNYHPWLVAIIGGTGTVVAYFSEYLFFTFLFRFNKVANFKNSWLYKKVAHLFDRHRFFILSFASFLPVPSESLRIYSISVKYSKFLYMIAGFIGRVPRYFLLGYYGKEYVNSVWFIIIVLLFPVTFLLAIRGFVSLINLIKMKTYAKTEESPVSIPVTIDSAATNLGDSDLEMPKS